MSHTRRDASSRKPPRRAHGSDGARSHGARDRRADPSRSASDSTPGLDPRPDERAVVIADQSIAPGEKRRVDLPVAKLPTGQQMSMPIIVVNGAKPGPSVWLSAALHGDELNGIEISRRVLTSLVPSMVSGVVYTVPVVNAFAFLNEARYLPDRRDLNRSFPGSRGGSLAARIAHLLMDTIVAHCSVGIDFHTGSGGRTNLPQVRVNADDPTAIDLARVFGAPCIIHGATRSGTLRNAATKRGAHVLVYEGGEANRFDVGAIQAGTDGVLRVLKHLEVVPDAPAAAETVFETNRSEWVRARRSGLVQFWVSLGAHITKGQPLGLITDTCGEIMTTISAPCDGLVVGLAVNPHAYRGDALVHIGRPMEG